MVLEMMSPIDIATVMCLIGGLEHVFFMIFHDIWE